MSSLSFFLKDFLRNLVWEVMAERTVLWWYQPRDSHLFFFSFECTKNSSSNENDNVLIFRVISEYRQL